jgi:Methyltransferase domain
VAGLDMPGEDAPTAPQPSAAPGGSEDITLLGPPPATGQQPPAPPGPGVPAEPEGFRLLDRPGAARHRAPPARPTASVPAEVSEATAEAPEARDWYQPTVASAMPYEFPSTGSVRLLPPPGGGPGGRAATARPASAPRAGAGRGAPASPTPPGSTRSAPGPRAAAPRANSGEVGAGQDRIVPERTAPGRTAPGRTGHDGAAGDREVLDLTIPGRGGWDRAASARANPGHTSRGSGSPERAATQHAAPDRATAGRDVTRSAAPEDATRAGTAGRAAPLPVVPRLARDDLFGRHIRSYAAECTGQQITILQAGCTTAEDLGTDALRAAGARLTVAAIDEDTEVTRAAVARHQGTGEAILGDLRTVALSPRAYDIVQCSALLGRIQHAELVLDRLTGAVKPGGLLLLRVRDRDSAAGFLDRVLPQVARRAIWHGRQPGEPGPHVAVYERISSARGVQAYVMSHGLVIAERGALGGLAGGLPRGPHGYLAVQKLVAWLSRGRLTSAHEELLYVIRKPEDRFARIL